MTAVRNVYEIDNGKVTFTLTLPRVIPPADLVSVLRQERAVKRMLGQDAAADAIGNLLSLAKTSFYL
jgi:hypothetical protein